MRRQTDRCQSRRARSRFLPGNRSAGGKERKRTRSTARTLLWDRVDRDAPPAPTMALSPVVVTPFFPPTPSLPSTVTRLVFSTTLIAARDRLGGFMSMRKQNSVHCTVRSIWYTYHVRLGDCGRTKFRWGETLSLASNFSLSSRPMPVFFLPLK